MEYIVFGNNDAAKGWIVAPATFSVIVVAKQYAFEGARGEFLEVRANIPNERH